jgi:hypothetical protein
MSIRPLLLTLFALPLCLGCNASDTSETPPVGAGPPELISGRYDVRGITAVVGTPDKRKIHGVVILVQDGDEYKATFELKTQFPADGTTTEADVIGHGSGSITGRQLDGSAETQIVVSAVPGVDTGFAFVPRTVSTRIVSTSTAKVAPNGAIEIQLENRPGPGEQYLPTRTKLAGTRTSGASASDILASAKR